MPTITIETVKKMHPVDLADIAGELYSQFQGTRSRQERRNLREQYNIAATAVNQKWNRKVLVLL